MSVCINIVAKCAHKQAMKRRTGTERKTRKEPITCPASISTCKDTGPACTQRMYLTHLDMVNLMTLRARTPLTSDLNYNYYILLYT
ncbi:hypothetical protein ElyMa_003802300 [Elysia marginata]|uniref:Uncharacterized protein n=1 Tax=Elysia marginata TaxID=1093978 RepID=A0AAV4FCS7_9GAST|nr:hypothetical protein ElyMa_003802300 [Elysia marginata]